LIFVYFGICFGKDPLPSLEGRIIKAEEDNSLLAMIEREVGIPTEFYRRLEFETGEEPYISIGVSTRIIPYYAKIRYLLDPEDDTSPYYLFSMGVSFIDGEELDFNVFLNDLAQRVNYGVGVGVTYNRFEIEILYGQYNYYMFGVPRSTQTDLYNSTKLTFNCKYRF
jgi:hypothetical protein